jgi:class 3 adenylate cyclase
VPPAGDGLAASFDGPARALRCAAAIVGHARALGEDAGAGVHTGECDRTPEGLRGIPVELAAGVAAQARPGEVLASSTVRDLVAGSGTAFAERGAARLPVDGRAAEWRLFALATGRSPAG